MFRSRGALVALLAAISSGCIGWEEPRPYDEFAAEYAELLDAGLIASDTGNDAATGSDTGADASDAGPTGFQPDPTWPDCSLPDATEQVQVTFVNDTDTGGALFWVDPQCQEFEVGVVVAGGELPQTTFVGHRFKLRIVRDDRRVVGGAYVSDAATTRINLSGEP